MGSIFFLRQDNEILCWVSTYPVSFKKDKEQKKKPASYLMTSVRPMRNIRDEFSFHIASNFSEDKKVNISIDKRVHYTLDPQGNWAWLRSPLDEGRMVVSSRNGNYLTSSYYKEGSEDKVTERFSLKGYTKAYETALEKCAPYFHKDEESDEKTAQKLEKP